jgi:hypothetical protein
LLWLERQEGYAEVFLKSYPLQEGDCMLVFSHGGMNAAPIEVALEAKRKGLAVVTVSSHANRRLLQPTHSSGKALSHVADIAIDNCVPPEDALVDIDAGEGGGWLHHGGGVRGDVVGGGDGRAPGGARDQAGDLCLAERRGPRAESQPG